MRGLRPPSLLAAAALAAALALACNEAAEPPFLAEVSPTPTVTPSPGPRLSASPPVETAGIEGFRSFAARIDAALVARDADFFADRGVEDEMTCAGDEQLGICYNQPAGTVLSGIPGAVAQSDAFNLFPPAEYAAMLRDWFASASPDGSPVLYALANSPAIPGVEPSYKAIVTGVFVVGPSGSTVLLRQGRIFDFQFLDGSWRLTGELFASVPETTEPWLSGDCAECYDHWERWEGAAP